MEDQSGVGGLRQNRDSVIDVNQRRKCLIKLNSNFFIAWELLNLIITIIMIIYIMYFSATQGLGILLYVHQTEDPHNHSQGWLNFYCIFILLDQVYSLIVEHQVSEEE